MSITADLVLMSPSSKVSIFTFTVLPSWLLCTMFISCCIDSDLHVTVLHVPLWMCDQLCHPHGKNPVDNPTLQITTSQGPISHVKRESGIWKLWKLFYCFLAQTSTVVFRTQCTATGENTFSPIRQDICSITRAGNTHRGGKELRSCTCTSQVKLVIPVCRNILLQVKVMDSNFY